MADITIPNVFVPHTLIESGQINENFQALADHAFNKSEGDAIVGNTTLTGDLAVTGQTTTGTHVVTGATTVGGSLAVTGPITGPFSGTLGSVSGANLTALNASALASGTAAVARLGSGTPSASTWLRGDGAWSVAPTESSTPYLSFALSGGITTGAGEETLATYTVPAAWMGADGYGVEVVASIRFADSATTDKRAWLYIGSSLGTKVMVSTPTSSAPWSSTTAAALLRGTFIRSGPIFVGGYADAVVSNNAGVYATSVSLDAITSGAPDSYDFLVVITGSGTTAGDVSLVALSVQPIRTL